MDTALWERVEAVFSEAVERPPEARAAFLDRACAGHDRLRREVEKLLAADVAAFALGVEERLLQEPEDAAEPAAGRYAGRRVGPYRLVREVGRGGMGAVYRAERADGAFDKTVALKLVKRGMDTDEVLARFRRERQVLASLEHPGIARLIDGGAADDGRPYLVMEYVAGETITDYCDRRALDVDARLSLFERVCEAVQHAHQHFVVHRDLKPSNILVTPEGEVKLLDFGIAKLLDPEAAGLSALATRTHARLLTPAYAAPEQLAGGAITTATDVFALGTLLYELLTARRPHQLTDKSAAEAERILREQEPVRPSQAAPDARRRRLRGDLDAICLKALRKESRRRYASVEALRTDVQRHRRGLPITARPETVGYRVRAFVRRHRVGVTATALVVLSLVGGLGAALWQARAAAQERDAARREADKAQQVTDFLVGVFEEADPRESGGRTLAAREVLDLGAARIEGELADQPEVQAALFSVVGRVYRSMGLYDAALPFVDQALALRRAHLGDAHPDVAMSLHDKANLLRDRGAYAAADTLYREALALRRATFGTEHPDVASTLDELALNLHYTGRREEAISLHREALAVRRRLLGPEHADLAASLNNLAGVLHSQGEAEEAEELYREALAMHRSLFGDNHPAVAATLNNIAAIRRRSGDLDAAEPLYREALAIWRRHYGDDHPHVAIGANNLGRALRERGDLDGAEPLYREALAIRQRIHDGQHPDIATSLNNLGKLLYVKGEYGAAEPLYREALAMWRSLYGDEYPVLANGLLNLADVRYARGDAREAEALYRQALTLIRSTRTEGHPKVGEGLLRLGQFLIEQRRNAEAIPLLEEGHAILRNTNDPKEPEAAAALAAARAGSADS